VKAAIVEEPNVLRVREVPVPEIDDYHALCETLYGATCSGTDLHIIKGRFPFGVDYPTILGHESTGRVIQVGAKVRNLKLNLVSPAITGLLKKTDGPVKNGMTTAASRLCRQTLILLMPQ